MSKTSVRTRYVIQHSYEGRKWVDSNRDCFPDWAYRVAQVGTSKKLMLKALEMVKTEAVNSLPGARNYFEGCKLRLVSRVEVRFDEVVKE